MKELTEEITITIRRKDYSLAEEAKRIARRSKGRYTVDQVLDAIMKWLPHAIDCLKEDAEFFNLRVAGDHFVLPETEDEEVPA
jgi:hypothetical protein